MNDDYISKVTASKNLHEKARYMRGRFLNSVAVIEHELAFIITKYFCTSDEKKRELFFKEIAGMLSLEKKRTILIKIMKSDYPTYYDKYRKQLIDIQKIQQLRNKFSHSILDVSDEALSRPLREGIGLIQWKKGEPITDEMFENWEVRTSDVHTMLVEIKQLLPYTELQQ